MEEQISIIHRLTNNKGGQGEAQHNITHGEVHVSARQTKSDGQPEKSKR